MAKHLLTPRESISDESVGVYFRHQRAISILLNTFLLKYLNSLYAEFDGDIVKAIILGELAHHNIAKLVKHRQLPISSVDESPGFENLRDLLMPGNPFSISESTGIPRETVRRKFLELVGEGLIEQVSPRSYIITARVSERFMYGFNMQVFEEVNCLCAKFNSILNGPEA